VLDKYPTDFAHLNISNYKNIFKYMHTKLKAVHELHYTDGQTDVTVTYRVFFQCLAYGDVMGIGQIIIEKVKNIFAKKSLENLYF